MSLNIFWKVFGKNGEFEFLYVSNFIYYMRSEFQISLLFRNKCWIYYYTNSLQLFAIVSELKPRCFLIFQVTHPKQWRIKFRWSWGQILVSPLLHSIMPTSQETKSKLANIVRQHLLTQREWSNYCIMWQFILIITVRAPL